MRLLTVGHKSAVSSAWTGGRSIPVNSSMKSSPLGVAEPPCPWLWQDHWTTVVTEVTVFWAQGHVSWGRSFLSRQEREEEPGSELGEGVGG